MKGEGYKLRRRKYKERKRLEFKSRYGIENPYSKNLYYRDGLYMFDSKCAECKKDFKKYDLTVDHIVPLSAGGSLSYNNLQLLCVPCHKEKTRRESLMYKRWDEKPKEKRPKYIKLVRVPHAIEKRINRLYDSL